MKNKKSFENISPIDLKKICDVSRSGLSDVNLAVSSAKNAFLEWSSFPGQERKKILHNIATSIEERAHEIALIESFDTGQSLRFMSKAALRGAANFRYFADQAPYGRDGESTFTNKEDEEDKGRGSQPAVCSGNWGISFMKNVSWSPPSNIFRDRAPLGAQGLGLWGPNLSNIAWRWGSTKHPS